MPNWFVCSRFSGRPTRAAAALLLQRSKKTFGALFGLLALSAFAPAKAGAQVDLVLNVVDSPDPVPRTGLVTYAVTIANNGLTQATGVSYTMQVPATGTYAGFTAGTGASCSGMTVNQVGPGTVTCTHPNLAFSASGSFSIQLRLNASVGSTVSVTQTVASAQTDAETGDNTVVSQTTVSSGADFRVVLSAPTSLLSGSTFNYALSVANDGPDAASALRVQFPFPTGFTQSGGLPSGCSVASNVLTCDVAGPIASGASVVIGNIPGKVTAAGISTLTGTASVALQPSAPALTPQDPNTGNNSSTASISVSAGSDLRLTKARSVGGPYFVGGTFNFVLTAAYDGNIPSNLVIADTLPANYTIGAVAATQNGWSCTVTGQVVRCTRASGGVAGNNQSLGSITIPVTIASPGTGVTNTGEISAASPTDPTPANNRGSDGGATLQTPTADLALTKTAPNPALVVVGAPFTWTLSASNGGPSAFFGDLVVTDTLPTGITINSYTLNGWSCDTPAPVVGPAVITCTRTVTSGAPLASGGTVSALLMNATATTAGAFTNAAVLTTLNENVADPSTGNNTPRSTVTASEGPDAANLSLIKTADLSTVPAGEVLTYSLEIVNTGPSSSASITLSDTFTGLINNGSGPTGQGYIGHTITRQGVAGTITCSNSASGGTGRAFSCTIPTLPVCTASVDCPVIAVAVRPGGNGGTRTNTASVVSSTVADPNTSNNSGSVDVTVDARADVTVTKTATPSPVPSGQAMTYTVAAVNNGPSQAANVVVTDTLPLGVRFISAAPSAGSCSTTPPANSVTTATDRYVVCNLTSINAGATRNVQIVVRPSTALRGTTIENRAGVTTTTIESTTPGATNNNTSRTDNVTNPALDILVNKFDSVDPLSVGDNTTYSIIINNSGPSDAENVVIRDTLPAGGLSYQSYTLPGGTCSVTPTVGAIGGELVCELARVAANTSVTMTVVMRGETKGVYTNRVNVASDETVAGFDPNLGNNSSPQTTTVRTRADMQVVSKTASSASVAVRRPYTWTIRVRNNTGAGLTEADTVVVTDTLPTNMQLTGTPTITPVSGTISANSCTGTAGGSIFTCDLGTVSSGAEVDIIVPVRSIAVPGGGTVTNRAHVRTFSQDITPGNNSNTGSTTITGSTLSGLVYRDFNDNGSVDAGDSGIGSITMTLSGTTFDNASVSFTATTLSDGTYSFTGLPEGTYTLTRGTVSESFLNVGQQAAGTGGGLATTPPSITSITIGENATVSGYRQAMVPIPRLGIAKRVLSTVANADRSLTTVLRLVVRNLAIEDMSGVTLTDTLVGAAPRLGTYVAGGTSATLSAGEYTLNAGPSVVGSCATATPTALFDGDGNTQVAAITTLNAGTSCEFAFSIRYQPTDPLPVGNYSNHAWARGTGVLSGRVEVDRSQDGANVDPDADGNPGNNTVPTPLNAVLAADVTTSVTLSSTVAAGEPVAGTVRFANNGPYTAQTVGYTLSFTPNLAGLTFSNLPTGATATYAPSTGVVTFTGMPTTLSPSQVASGDGTNPIQIAYTQNGVANSTMTSGISTTSNEGQNLGPNAATATVTGPLIADVTTTLTFPTLADAGTTVSGTVVFRNTGPSVASGMTYALTLNTGLANVAFTNLPSGATATYNSSTGQVTFTNMPATLAMNALASGNGTSGIGVSYTQNATANSTVSSVIGTSTSQGANAAPDTATTTITGDLIADVTTSLSFPGTVNAGNVVSGTILFRNNGPSVASGVTYTMTLTTGLTDVLFGNLPSGATAAYNATTGVVTFSGMPVTLNAAQIASGNGTSGVTLSYTQPGTATSTITSQIGTSTNQGVNAAPDNAVANTGGIPIADVRAQVSFPTTVNAGQPVSGTIRFSNVGPSPAATVTYTFTMAPALTGVVFGNLPTGATAVYNSTTGAVTFTGMPATLAPSQLASGNGTSGITVTYTQNSVANTTNTAVIATSTDQGANLAPDTEAATVTGALIADVTTALLTFPPQVSPGNMVTGRLVFRNDGPSVASAMTYAATLTPGLTGVVFGNLPTGATATYASGTGLVTFTGMPATLAPGAMASNDGTNGISLSYVQSGVETVVTATIGTATNQGANVLPDAAQVTVTGLIPVDLRVVKTISLTQVAPGDTVRYTVRFSNSGPIALPAGSVIADEPSSGLTLMAVDCTALPGNRCTTPPTVSQLLSSHTLPAMPVGERYELAVTAVVTAPAGQSVVNAATIDVPAGYIDSNPTNNRSVAGPVPVRLSPNLALSKLIAQPLVAGATGRYAFIVRNVGDMAPTGPMTLTDLLPAALTFRSATGAGWSCSAANQLVTCTNSTPLLPGASSRFDMDVAVAASAPATIRNTAHISTPGDVRFSNDTSRADATVSSAPDLALTKRVNTDTLRLGETALYTLTIRNQGGAPTTALMTVVDTLPNGITPVTATGADFTCTVVGQVVTCTRTAPLTQDASAVISIASTITSAFAGGAPASIRNTACVRMAGDARADNDCGEVITPLGGRREAEFRKEAVGTFAVGQPGVFRLVVRNRGSLPLQGPLAVTDSLPRGLTYAAAQGNGWVCTNSANVVHCQNAGPLAVGDSASVMLTVNVGAGAVPQVTNCASLAVGNTTLANGGRSCATVQPRSTPDLTLVKTVSSDTLRVGGTATFTLSVTNRGDVATSALFAIIDTLPASLAPLSARGAESTCTIAGQVVRCERTAALAPNATFAVTITATVRSSASLGALTNTACVRSPEDLSPANDCDDVTATIGGRREASLRKEAVGDFVVGEPGRFRLWVRNSGTVALEGPLVVVDSLPNGLTFASATGTGWSCSADGPVVRCDRSAALGVGDSSAVVLQTNVLPAAVPEVTNCATLSVAGGAVLAANGRACATVRPTADYRLVLELTTPRYQRELGEVPDFTILVRNTGRSPLRNVVVSNLLPAGFTYVAGSSARGGRPDATSRARLADPSGGVGPTISWPVGDMAPGQVIRVDYRAQIRTGASFNADNITQSTAVSENPGLRVTSNTATVPIKLERGVFETRGIIAGKVYLECDCEGMPGQNQGEIGIPGVRVVLEDGTGAITDVEGKYNILNVRAGLHVVKVDRTTLPAGATLKVLNTRNAGDAYSRFVDLKVGELHRADFAEGSRSEPVLNLVLARRRQGEVGAASDSARMAATMVTPLTMTPTLTTPLTTAAPTTSVFTPLAVPNALHDGNSNLPVPPVRAAAMLTGQPSDSGTGRTTRELISTMAPAQAPVLVPAPRPLLATGLLQGRIDLRQLSRGALNVSGLDDGFEGSLKDIAFTSDSGRVRGGLRGALLLKGDVKKAGLLTLAFDSEWDRERTQFRDITPDQGFPIFGDASLREFDAQSQQRVYARLDNGASFLRYGDFATPRSDDRRLLLAYDRSMTGLTYHAEGTRAVFNGFYSRNGIRQTVDELRGRGLSGPYYLTQPNAVINSERVELVTRDRNQPAVILRTQPMARFAEYTIEPLSGRLIFRAPVPSLDANLNPVTIRVSYEVAQGGAQFNTYGGDARLRVGSRLEVGAFAVRDDNPMDEQTLLGLSATGMLGSATAVLGELARTETGVGSLRGDAWRVELRHQQARVEARLFAMQGDTAFANRSSTFVGGREEYGARFSAVLNTRTRILGEALHTADVRTDGRRDGALLAVERRLSSRMVAELGYRWADENGASVSPVLPGSAGGLFGGTNANVSQGLTPLSFSAARARLTARVPGSDRSSLFGEYEYGLDASQARRGAIGGEYLLMDKARVYLRHEWLSSQSGPYALREGRDQQNTVFGVDMDMLRNSQIFSEYRARDAFNGRDAEASIGLRNRWMLKPGILANTTFERVAPLSGDVIGQAYAATGALEFTQSARWKGSTRLEWRTTPTGDNLLGSLGYAHKLSRDWTMLGRTLWDQLNNSQLRGRTQVGVSWRETDRNRINALFRVENRLDRTDAQGNPTSRTVANIAAALVNMQLKPSVTVSARYAGKRATDTRDGIATPSAAHLVMARTIIDLTHRLDLGLIGSVLGNGSFAERRYGTGVELGAVVMRNVRLAAGYNVFGFTDRDFESLGYTQRGPYVEFGFKFDEALLNAGRKE